MAYIYEYLKIEYGKKIWEGNFYDLGSGEGKPVLAMSLLTQFKKLIGIEFLENLNKLSLLVKQKYEKEINDIINKNKDLFFFEKPNNIEFIRGDFFENSWEEASVIFVNSTCFSESMMNDIASKANRECKKGTIIITLTKKLYKLNSDWELRDGFRRLMTWGIATIYIHRRKTKSN